jgi:hypothetical protein
MGHGLCLTVSVGKSALQGSDIYVPWPASGLCHWLKGSRSAPGFGGAATVTVAANDTKNAVVGLIAAVKFPIL